MPHKRRALFVLPLIVLVFSILGGFYGPQISAVDAATPSDGTEPGLETEMQLLTHAVSVVEQNEAEVPSQDKIYYKGAIPGMLRELDPHSNFFDPKDFKLLEDDQKGSYFGVGMMVSTRNGKTVVIAPFPGSPAYRVGLRPGDIIVSVDDKSTDGLNTTEVADLLKGPRGTQVKVVISREGAPDYLSFTVIRDEITRKSVPEAFYLKNSIAYIKILSFTETTPRELDDALAALNENEMRGLVLDLRDNPGGLLNSGVAVAGHFLRRGQVVVSSHGRNSPEKVFTARNGSHGLNYPVVVLVDRMSASAAEIVSGALQDHDRAWILGEKTFGKGLVQTVFPLSYNTALALTTAHFYTPSGRLIQRDYSNESFYDYYFHRDDTVRNPNDVKMTDGGRTVYGGGGITPDQKYEAAPMDHLEIVLNRDGLFNFTRAYFVKHTATLPQGWLPGEPVIAELHDYLMSKKVNFTQAEFTRDHDWIKRYLTKEMYIYAFNVDESDREFAQSDPEVGLAVEAMPKALTLLQGAQRAVGQRMEPSRRAAAAAH
jgi:carboxyl-terminal processing protease